MIVIIFSFIYFRKIDAQENETTIRTIETLLRNEINFRNTYALSKSLVDLEKLGLFSCASIKEQTSNFAYYDTISAGACSTNLLLSFRIVSAQLISNNGFVYSIKFVKYPNIFSLIVEVSLYLILFAFAILLPEYMITIEHRLKIKLKALEIEKFMLLNQAQQISHDVASPLSAINLVVGLLKNIDPEIKDILTNSVKRTQLIFDELRNSKNTLIHKNDETNFYTINNCILFKNYSLLFFLPRQLFK